MAQICIILRGLSGSGKSTLARRLADHYQAVICSADNYFLDQNEVYRFDRTKLAHAHADCYAKFLKLVAFQGKNVIIDNTNSRHWEYMKYRVFAAEHDYDLRIVEILCRDEAEMQMFWLRSHHGALWSSLQDMRARWQNDPQAELISSSQVHTFI